MDTEKYAWLPAALREWHEAYIGELCQDDKLMCDELCRKDGEPWKCRKCIVLQAADAIEELLGQ